MPNIITHTLFAQEIFDKVGTVDFDDNSSITAILEKADKVMVKHSDYLVKVVE